MLSGLPEVLFLFLTPIQLLINNYTSIFSNNTSFNCPKNHTWKTYSTLSSWCRVWKAGPSRLKTNSCDNCTCKQTTLRLEVGLDVQIRIS